MGIRFFAALVLVAAAAAGAARAEDTRAFSFIEANGVELAYLEEGTGPLVVLLHGYPETARGWKQVQAKLAAAGYRVVAPNMRGYAPSGFAPDEDYTVGTLGADALALIEALDESKAVVVGHDWGATAAMSAAVTDPDTVVGLVSLTIPHPMATEPSLSLFLNAPHFIYYQFPWASWMVARNDFAHIDGIVEAWAPTFDVDRRDTTAVKESLAVEGGVEGVLGYYWSISADPTPGTMRADTDTRFAMPTLMIAGADDGALDIELFEAGKDGFTGPYTYVELEGVGHFPQVEAPDDVAAALLTFLGSIEPWGDAAPSPVQ